MTDAAVVIPAFERPEQLARCLRALALQEPAPRELLVAAHAGDAETLAAVERLRPDLGVPLKLVSVTAEGHLPPLAAGVRATGAGVVAFVDDDAEPWPGWLAALLRHYAQPQVGGVGGLVVQPGLDERRVADAVGIVRRGRFDALGTERIPSQWGARETHAIRGTNMSFRRELLAAFPWDARVNRGAATDYEVDLCAWVRRRGYRLLYDPDAVVSHYLAPRPRIGRAATPERIADYSHNLVYVSGKALPPAAAALAVASAFLVGNRASYGLLTALADTLRGRPPSPRHVLAPALRGKLDGLRSLRAYRRSGPQPFDRTP